MTRSNRGATPRHRQRDCIQGQHSNQAGQTLLDMTIRALTPRHIPSRPQSHQRPFVWHHQAAGVRGADDQGGRGRSPELVIEDPIRTLEPGPRTICRRRAARANARSAHYPGLHPGVAIEGNIARINPSVETASRTFQVETVVSTSAVYCGRRIFQSLDHRRSGVQGGRGTHRIDRAVCGGPQSSSSSKTARQSRSTTSRSGSEGRADGSEVTSELLPASAQIVTTGQTQLAEGTPSSWFAEPEADPSSGKTGTDRGDRPRPPKRPSRRARPGGLSKTRSLGRGRRILFLFFCLYRDISMTLSDVCIKRPVFTWVLVAIPVVLGLFSYGELGVDLFSRRRLPAVHGHGPCCKGKPASRKWRRRSPSRSKTSSTRFRAVKTSCGRARTEGVSAGDRCSSCSPRMAMSGCRRCATRSTRILADLPYGTDPPIVDKFDTSSMPVMTIAVSGRRDFRGDRAGS